MNLARSIAYADRINIDDKLLGGSLGVLACVDSLSTDKAIRLSVMYCILIKRQNSDTTPRWTENLNYHPVTSLRGSWSYVRTCEEVGLWQLLTSAKNSATHVLPLGPPTNHIGNLTISKRRDQGSTSSIHLDRYE